MSLTNEYLRYPDTFERLETGMGPKEEDGTRFVYVKFRAKNALGVPSRHTASGRANHDTCMLDRSSITVFED